MTQEHHDLFSGLLIICEEICRTVGGDKDLFVPDKIVLALFIKATNTLKGIKLLYENNLYEEAQSLVRILFETQINFCMFLSMLCKDPLSACRRVLDSMMLEKVKQQRACNFAGLDLIPDAPSQQDLLDIEKQIAGRYTEQELKKIRKYGFTGISIEQRAIKTGDKEMYDIIYRNFSRNVHANDYSELLLTERPELSRGTQLYFESRNCITYQVTEDSIGKMMYLINKMFNLGFEDIVTLADDC